MNLSERPSRCFLFDRLEQDLELVKGEWGMDAACSSFTNLHMFGTRRYVGVDLREDRLRGGLARHSQKTAIGLLADISQLEPIPTGSMDVVVSTNTIYQIPADRRRKAVAHLCRLVSPSGMLICEMPLSIYDNRIRHTISEAFSHIQTSYFKNVISSMYEDALEGDDGRLPVWSMRWPMRIFAWILGQTEYITSNRRASNRHIYVVAKEKRDKTCGSFEPHTFASLFDRCLTL